MFAAFSLLLVLPALCVGRYVDRLYPPYVGMTGIYPGGLPYRSVHGWGKKYASMMNPVVKYESPIFGWGDNYGSWLNPLTKYDVLRRMNTKSYSPLSNMFLRNLLEKSYKHKYGGLDSTNHRMLFDKDFTGFDTSLYGDKYLSYNTKIMPDVPMLTLGMKLKLMTIMSFKKMDINNDGFISKQELVDKIFGAVWGVKTPITKIDIERMVDVVTFDPQTKRVLLTHFDDLDKDKNGVLDGVDIEVIFDEIDKNKDYLVSETEYKRFISKQLYHIPALTLGMKVIILASQSFKKMDINGDGLISKPEMEIKFFEKDTTMSGLLTKGEYEQWVDVEEPGMMTKIVLEKHFDDLDKDGNGVLDKQDIDIIFYEIDTDSDSFVTEEEYKKYIVKKMFQFPTMTLGMTVEMQPLQWFLKMDVNGDGFVSKTEMKNTLITKDQDGNGIVTWGEYETWADVEGLEPHTKVMLKNLFDMMDKDKNGVLDISDIETVHFEADTNKDGLISEEEFITYVTRHRGCISTFTTGMGVESITGMGVESMTGMGVGYITPIIFTKLDTNVDGLVSKSDMVFKLFETDLNKDGLVTRMEFHDWVDTHHTNPEPKVMLKDLFDIMDKDKKGAVDMTDIDVMFDQTDLDRDNHISDVEFHRYLETMPEIVYRRC